MHAAIAAFLRYLEVERNSSPLTLKSYREDLECLLDFYTSQSLEIPDVAAVTTAELRTYVAWLHECGYARSTIARRSTP